MKIGYSVEGSTDRAFLHGLRRRWCPQAEIIQGQFRGRSGLSRHREIPSICLELSAKRADLIIFLRDANNESWRDVLKNDQEKCLPEHRHIAVFGVCDRNIECWICTSPEWLEEKVRVSAGIFRTSDPKDAFESALKISRTDKKEAEIAEIVVNAPIHQWLANRSFEHFYEDLWQKSKEQGCAIENLRERA